MLYVYRVVSSKKKNTFPLGSVTQHKKKPQLLFLSLQCYRAFWLSFLANTPPYTLPCKPGLPPGVMFRNESKTSKLGLCCIIFTIYWGSKNLCKWVLRVAAYSLSRKDVLLVNKKMLQCILGCTFFLALSFKENVLCLKDLATFSISWETKIYTAKTICGHKGKPILQVWKKWFVYSKFLWWVLGASF